MAHQIKHGHCQNFRRGIRMIPFCRNQNRGFEKEERLAWSGQCHALEWCRGKILVGLLMGVVETSECGDVKAVW